MPTIRKRGNKFQVQVRLKEDGVVVFNQSATFDTERQARLWGNSLEAKVLKEGPDQHVAGAFTTVQLAKAYSEYRESIRPMARGTQHSIRELMSANWARQPISKLNAKDLTAWGTARAETVSPATVMHHFMVLRSMMSMAESLVGMRPNMGPIEAALTTLKRVRLVGRSQERDRRVTDAELATIVAHLRGKMLMVPTDEIIQLAVALPRRREELLTMRWSDYDGTTLKLRDTKNPNRKRDEVIPVPPTAKAIIDVLPKYPGEDRMLPFKPESVSAAFQRAVREIGLADIRLHDLRHEGISRLFEQGLQIQEVALISGHVSWTALRRYTHIKPHDVVEKLNARIQKAQEAAA